MRTKTLKPAVLLKRTLLSVLKNSRAFGGYCGGYTYYDPTSTAIFKTLIALKTRNAIIISPHPRAKNSTIEAAKIVLEAAVKAGAPEGIIGWIDVPSLELTNLVMREQM